MKQKLKGFFIAGTDTGVGKTLIASALLVLLKQKKFKTIVLKPIATGSAITPQGLRNNDACLLQEYITEKLTYTDINPFAFYEPIAPHIAANIENQTLSVKIIMDTCKKVLDKPADFVVIEGIGGWRVPLNANETTADLAKALGYPVILVVGMRVGCLNHALLTIENMQKHAVTLAGWVANSMQPEMPYLDQHINALKELIPAPLLGIVPYKVPIDVSHVSLHHLLLRLKANPAAQRNHHTNHQKSTRQIFV